MGGCRSMDGGRSRGSCRSRSGGCGSNCLPSRLHFVIVSVSYKR